MNNPFPDKLVINAENLPLIAQFAECIPGGFFIYHADGDEEFIYFNTRLTKIFGCNSDDEFRQLTGNSFKKLVHPDDLSAVENEIILQAIVRGNNLDHVKYRFIRKDGSIGMLDDYGNLVHSQTYGDVFCVFVEDISTQINVDNLVTLIYNFTDDFSSVYLINAPLDQFKILKQNPELTIAIDESKSYSDSISAYISTCVAEEDKEKMVEATRQDTLGARFQVTDSLELSFQDCSLGYPRVHRMKLTRLDEEQFLLAFLDIDESETRRKISSALFDSYFAIFYVDLEYDIIKTLKESGYYSQDKPHYKKYSESYAFFAQALQPKDSAYLKKIATCDSIKATLITENKHEYSYLSPYAHEWVTLSTYVMSRSKDGVPLSVIHCFSRVDAAQKQTIDYYASIESQSLTHQSVIAAMAEDFDAIAILDFTENKLDVYQTSTKFASVVQDISPADQMLRYQTFLERTIPAKNKEQLLNLLSRDHVFAELADKKSYTFEIELIINGTPEYYRIKFADIPGNNDKVIIGYQNVNRQIRDAQAAGKLAADMEQQKVIAALADDFDLVCLIDVTTNAEQIFKFEENKLNNLPGWTAVRNFTDRLELIKNTIVHPDDRDLFYQSTRKSVILEQVKQHGSYSFIYRNLVNDTLTYWRAQFTLVEMDTTQIVAAFIDITDERLKDMATEAMLRKQLSIIKGLTEDYVNVCYMDLQAKTIENIAIGEVIQKDVGKLIQDSATIQHAYQSFVDTLVHPDYREAVRPLMNMDFVSNLLASQKEHRVIYRRLYGSTYKWSEVTLIKAEDTHETPAHVSIGFAEIDERYKAQLAREQIRKEYEDELIDARDRAEVANRAKSRFLFSMSHDLHTPMNAITGFTDMARRHIDDQGKVLECLAKIAAAGTNLLEFINQVLEMSRLETEQFELHEEPADIVARIHSMADLIAQDAAIKDITVDTVVDHVDHPAVYADVSRMNQLIISVLTNAIRYTPAGGHIVFTASQKPCDKPDHATFIFTIKDNGIGMSKAFLPSIFEPFSRENTTTVSKISGTGLGMSIAKKLIDFMGGDITVESESGQGTTVTVTIRLRLYEESADLKAAADINTMLKRLQGRRALLVDDNEMNREIAVEILEEQGMTVDQAEDGDIAVDKLKELADQGEYRAYDFILMDIQMPRMNGYEATRLIRQMYAPVGIHIPIIAVTANDLEEDRLNTFAAGLDEHLAKPVNAQKLCETLIKFL